MDEAYDEVARSTSERGEVVLMSRGGVQELRVNGVFVMNTAETGSETELARAALALVDEPGEVLVGGLGLGYTAHEVLADHRVRRLVVVEVESALVEWMRVGRVRHGPAALADDRMTVTVADIRSAISELQPGTFDLVLLDVDNGPGYLVFEDNAEIYRPAFLAKVREVLRPGGVLVVWSAASSDELQASMAAVFGSCEAIPHPVRLQTRDESYWLYRSRRASD